MNEKTSKGCISIILMAITAIIVGACVTVNIVKNSENASISNQAEVQQSADSTTVNLK